MRRLSFGEEGDFITWNLLLSPSLPLLPSSLLVSLPLLASSPNDQTPSDQKRRTDPPQARQPLTKHQRARTRRDQEIRPRVQDGDMHSRLCERQRAREKPPHQRVEGQIEPEERGTDEDFKGMCV
ncbi:hypothetical protein ANO11243_030840 [Dothideomycetidae sp. 11243]|nr:hypothetical protein ANO11243_030840 [fungal sp. No.11243]